MDRLERAVLSAVAALTGATYAETDGDALVDELARRGFEPDEVILYNLLRRLKEAGYLTYHAGGGMNVRASALLQLTPFGHEAADQYVEPAERIISESRQILASESFVATFDVAYSLWTDAERLLFSDDAEDQLTVIGHKTREATQAFAARLVELHRPDSVDPNPTMVKRRVGAVIAMHRSDLGETRRQTLEALGNLWEATNDLIQRQEHAATKESQPVTRDDARRVVLLTLVLMVELNIALSPYRRENMPDQGSRFTLPG